MWIDNIMKALSCYAEKHGLYNCCIDKIENNFIYLSSGEKIPFRDLL